MNSLICFLNFHKWQRVGITKPIRKKSDFVERLYLGHRAMGECELCGIQKLRNVVGYWEWYHSDEVTEEEYKEKFKEGEYNLKS